MRVRAKIKPIREHEGLSWEAFCEAIKPTPPRECEQPLLAFAEPPKKAVREKKDKARAPPKTLQTLRIFNPSPSSQIGERRWQTLSLGAQ